MTFLEIARYVFHNAVMPEPEVTFFPKGGPYVCGGGCKRTFPNYHTRNYHEWKEHPGCPRFRKLTFWAWLREGGTYHRCRCHHASECTHGCWQAGTPYRG